MLNITKIDDGLLFSKDGVNEQIFPLNELVLLVEDISDIVVFKTDDYYETVFQARWQDITIEGERVTKENIVEKFNAIANTPQGGGSGISDAPSDGKKYVRQNANWVQETTVDTSNFATKAELEGKVDDAEIADMLTKTEAASTYQPKGDYLTEIPSEYVTETELSEKGYATTVQLDEKQDTLVSGTNIKTINGETLLGEGNIVIEGGTSDVTKQYVDEQLALKADKTSVPVAQQKNEKGDNTKYIYAAGSYQDKTFNVIADLYLSDTKELKLNYKWWGWSNNIENVSIRNASQTLDGAMSAEDKIKLDSINVDTLATKEELNLKANTSDLSNYLTTTNAESTYAKKSEIPSLEGYLQTSTADGKYATKTEIADMLTKTEASTTYALQSALQAALDRISALESQVGNISTQLDNINGETIN